MTRRVLIFAVLAAAVLGAAPASSAAPVDGRERAQQDPEWERALAAGEV